MAILPPCRRLRAASVKFAPALRFKSNDSLLRHFKDTSTVYLETDYPGEWPLDLPMLAQDYFSWSRQMTGLLNSQRRMVGEMANDVRRAGPASACRRNRLAILPPHGPIISITANSRGCTLFSRRFVLLGDMAGAPRCEFFPRPDVDARASPNRRRPISTPMPECCASGFIITARKW